MSTFFRLFFLIVLFSCHKILAQETLTNESIVAMQQAKLSRSLIEDKIRTSPNKFDLSTIGLLRLKTERVPDALIDVMLSVATHRDVLHNNDIVNLYQGGISRPIITRKIQDTKTDFDLSTSGLIQLKTAKIPEPIVRLMMNPSPAASSVEPAPAVAATPANKTISRTAFSKETTPETATHPGNLPVPTLATFPEPGIFYEEFRKKGEYMELESTTTNMAKSGSFGEALLGGYTNGASGSTQRVGLANKSSNFVIDDIRPVFYFRFNDTRKQMDDVAEGFWSGVSSPNEFVLIKANTSGRGRQITVGRSSAYTSERGVTGNTVPFRFKKIATGLYRVYFEQNVPAGEYVFFYNKGSEQSSSIKVYDFSQRSKEK
ncbi:hypothetical protein [Spirosoma spitsbergense]|uniref:hypothetical protein n=1 Tax=Spirosoma spitsbergense TaxID=431554 RepID=UPI00037498ED|nr:hypothetical protein [Spirosoma spitsbergense]